MELANILLQIIAMIMITAQLILANIASAGMN
jgi:hypothetical protein